MAIGDVHILDDRRRPLCGASGPARGFGPHSPACVTCRNLKRRSPNQPVPAALTPAPTHARTFRVLGEDNGHGLSRDRSVINAAFQAAGWEIDTRADATVAVNVHLERIAPRFFGRAQRNVIIPNPEWWSAEHTALLRDPSAIVWAKTEDAARIFRELGARVAVVGFCSADRFDPTIERDRTFLHVAGVGPNKSTHLLLASWRPEWPHLTVVGAALTTREAGNVSVIGARITDEAVHALQNRHVFHIYPSRYEGFGHAQWEGASCGGIVFVQDGPPFEAWPDFQRMTPTTPGAVAPNRLVRWCVVSEAGIALAVERAAAMTAADVTEARQQARASWEKQGRAFTQRVGAQLAALDDQAPALVLAQTSQQLASLPAMNYVGRVDCVTGYGAAARHQIWALRQHGLRLHVVDAGSTCSPDPQRADPFIQETRRSDVERREATGGTIFHLAPNCVHKANHPRPHILVSVWETTRLPREWVPLINGFDQVWCATHWQREVYAASGVTEAKLRVVPFALDPSLYTATGTALAEVRKGRRVVFGSVFQWSERKNPAALIGAYLQAFSAQDDVVLVLKGYEGDSPRESVAQHVKALVASFRTHTKAPEIVVLSRAFTGQDMHAFYRSIDCYVSAHRGEGFGLPIAEALLTGKRVIATNWSAPAEYAAGCFRGIDYSLEPPRGMNWQPFYTVDQNWAHVSVSGLAAAMREAYEGKLTFPEERVSRQFTELFHAAGQGARAALEALR